MKNLKSKIIIFCIIALTSLSSVAFAQDEDKINVLIDNKAIEFDVNPIVIEGRTMVPFRKIFEIFNFKVDWSESTSTVLANKGSQIIVLQIDNKKAFINNEQLDLDVPAQLINGRTMVPLRFISENIGATVEWIAQTRTVSITSKAN